MGALKAGCERAREWVSLDLDGGLWELEQELLRAHLRHCPTCAPYARAVRTLTEIVRATPAVQPTVAVATRPPIRSRRPPLRLAAAAAVVVAAAALGSLAGTLAGRGADSHQPATELLAVHLPPSMAAPIPVHVDG
jgi:predicted anti-sigma-YlaC factor YlaD